jgi:hypothetical protein
MYRLNFDKKKHVSEDSFFPFSGKEALNLVDPLDQAIFSHWTAWKCSTYYAPQKRSSPQAVTGK